MSVSTPKGDLSMLVGPMELPDGSFIELDLQAIAGSPRAVYDLLRRLLVRVGEDVEIRTDSDEDPQWIESQANGRKVAVVWLLMGFMVLLRRQVESRNAGIRPTGEAIPEVDQAVFRALFGFPEKADLRADAQFIVAHYGAIFERSRDFADEFAVMYADWMTSLDSDAFIPRDWRAGIEAPWVGVKRAVAPAYKVSDVRIAVIGASMAPAAPVHQVPAEVVSIKPSALQADLEEAKSALSQLQQQVASLQAELAHERSDGVAAQYRDLMRSLQIGRAHV
jgi:hypothetical protein